LKTLRSTALASSLRLTQGARSRGIAKSLDFLFPPLFFDQAKKSGEKNKGKRIN
jgi:hypothetical protein